jgi:uncharacterized lipoprotein
MLSAKKTRSIKIGAINTNAIKTVLGKRILFASVTASALAISGCSLSPQIIPLETASPLTTTHAPLGRSALVRVRDLRADTDQLGHRGGTKPEQAPLLSKPSLQQALSNKMQASLQQLGFGGVSPLTPVKVDLAIEKFNYQCNQGWWVNQCKISMAVNLTIDNDAKTYSQPFSLNQQRSVATAPRVGYNAQWINESIDELWLHILSQPQVEQVLGL